MIKSWIVYEFYRHNRLGGSRLIDVQFRPASMADYSYERYERHFYRRVYEHSCRLRPLDSVRLAETGMAIDRGQCNLSGAIVVHPLDEVSASKIERVGR